MRIFVTGATGFLGSAVTRAAAIRGHEVVRLVRRADPMPIVVDGHPANVRDVIGDIRHPEPWQHVLGEVDAVVHLAAAKSGDFHTQLSTTVLGTEVLLAAMRATGLRRLVHVSTFSVYDYRALAIGTVLDEQSPLEQRPLDRDEYAQVKLVQEQLVRTFAERDGDVTIVRPGAVYGPGNLWNAGIAMNLPGGLGLAIAPFGRQKLTYVDNCADAIVLAAERDAAIGATIDIVDDDLPTQLQFWWASRRCGLTSRYPVPVPYRVASMLAILLDALNRRVVSGRAKFPGVVVPAKQAAQYRPLRYSNGEAKRILGWRPRHDLASALERIRRSDNP